MSATPVEVAAVLAALAAQRAREQPVNNYEKWRRVRQIAVAQAK
ncbi:hypothetical protein [uncultured Jatrophihabitans sp.]